MDSATSNFDAKGNVVELQDKHGNVIDGGKPLPSLKEKTRYADGKRLVEKSDAESDGDSEDEEQLNRIRQQMKRERIKKKKAQQQSATPPSVPDDDSDAGPQYNLPPIGS